MLIAVPFAGLPNPAFSEIAVFKTNGTFYKGFRYTLYPIIADIPP